MAASNKVNGRVPRLGPKDPVLTCPFTGEPLEIEFNEILGQYRAVGKLWVTHWYDERQALLYDISQRDGVAPNFPRRIIVEVKDREPPPPDPRAGLGASDAVKEQISEKIDEILRGGAG
jgi:hypothetical protein